MSHALHLPHPARVFGVPVRWCGVVLGVTLILICASFAVLLWGARVAEYEKSSTAAANLSVALTQDIARNIELYDLSIRGVTEGMANKAVMAETPELRQLVLFDRAATAPFLGSIIVLDERGDVLLDSSSLVPRTYNYADRAYFKAQSSRSDLGLFVSEPFQAKSNHEWVINLSRRYDKPDGSFGGVVAGTLRLDYLHRLFARMRLGPNGSLTLFRTDGTVVMREPYDPAILGKVLEPALLFDRLAEAPEGEYEARSAVDGVERLYHYQRVGDLPLVQNVAMSVADIYADWWRKAVEVSAVLATACLVIVTLALILRGELHRRLRAEAALTTLAGEDPLTRLANRRRFDEVLAEEFRRAVRHGWRLSLMMVDADHFKSYNDAFGHVAGDTALVALAACLARRTQRSGDLAARYGGEEFAVILPHVSAVDALGMAEEIRRDVVALGLRSPASKHGTLSISIGIASVTLHPDDTPADLIETADDALYRSKAAGRDRSTLFAETKRRAAESDAAAKRVLTDFGPSSLQSTALLGDRIDRASATSPQHVVFQPSLILGDSCSPSPQPERRKNTSQPSSRSYR